MATTTTKKKAEEKKVKIVAPLFINAASASMVSDSSNINANTSSGHNSRGDNASIMSSHSLRTYHSARTAMVTPRDARHYPASLDAIMEQMETACEASTNRTILQRLRAIVKRKVDFQDEDGDEDNCSDEHDFGRFRGEGGLDSEDSVMALRGALISASKKVKRKGVEYWDAKCAHELGLLLKLLGRATANHRVGTSRSIRIDMNNIERRTPSNNRFLLFTPKIARVNSRAAVTESVPTTPDTSSAAAVKVIKATPESRFHCLKLIQLFVTWSCLILVCQMPWMMLIYFLSIQPPEGKVKETCNRNLNGFLLGFLILLGVHSTISVVASSASALRDERKKRYWHARAKYAVATSSAVMLAYNFWGLTLVWDKGSDCSQVAPTIHGLSLAVVIVFMAIPCICAAIRYPARRMAKQATRLRNGERAAARRVAGGEHRGKMKLLLPKSTSVLEV